MVTGLVGGVDSRVRAYRIRGHARPAPRMRKSGSQRASALSKLLSVSGGSAEGGGIWRHKGSRSSRSEGSPPTLSCGECANGPRRGRLPAAPNGQVSSGPSMFAARQMTSPINCERTLLLLRWSTSSSGPICGRWETCSATGSVPPMARCRWLFTQIDSRSTPTACRTEAS